jgi:flavin reductase (DIM6/NTAB) family NADH-FMN oxidoreductase RutF
MHFDLARIAETDAYKLLVSTVVPRPIALTTTVDAAGRVNAAPFSFFNAVSSRPPVVVLGISPGGSGDDGYKDTERNIRDTGEFVVNLVDEALAERMNICDVAFPTGINELEMAELHPLASVEVKPPRIAEAPVSFECKRITGLSLGARSTLEVGRVIHIHIRDDLVDPERFYVQTDKMRLVGRMHGRGWYARTSDLFLMDRISLAEWKDGKR